VRAISLPDEQSGPIGGGINADKFNQGSSDKHGGYDAAPESYWALVDCLGRNLDRLTAKSTPIVFWFSMHCYEPTLRALTDQGWNIEKFPLVRFRSDNSNILPDPNRRPRRVYETAFFGHCAGRQVVRAVRNLKPATSDQLSHMSAKPASMLHHFSRMVVDE
jgi:hypothetical protein